MTRYEATFQVDSKNDSYAVRQMLESVHDVIREESRTVRDGSEDASALLQEFRSLRDAAKEPSPGELTIVYEQYDDEFDE
jgi:uncharacterized protein YyaL (SSP411 family)